MIKPPTLRRGDTIGIVAPASPSFNPEDLEKGKETLERLGFKVVLGKTLLQKKRMDIWLEAMKKEPKI